MSEIRKNDKRIMNGWAMYDWANSVFSLTIATAVFPIYFKAVTPPSAELFGNPVKSTALYEYSVSLAFLIVALVSPLLSGIVDYRGNKKNFMRFFVWMGSLGCMAMYFFTGQIWLGLGLLVISTIGFAGSLVYYNSYLPDIATPDQFDRLSARGFSLGYIGSVLLLIINLIIILKPALFGIPPENKNLPSQIAFLSVGLWWIGFSQFTFRRLPSVKRHTDTPISEVISKGYTELMKVWKQLKNQKSLLRFLASFFVFTMGVQTVMYLATLFGTDALQLKEEELIGTVLIIQLIAIAGAWAFSRISAKLGNTAALKAALVIWVGICIGAFYLPVGKAVPFFILGSVVGLVMGGVQSCARATYAKLIPETEDTASYFSFYEFTEKIGIVAGTFSYGLIDHLTHDMRNSVVVLAIYFITGLLLLFRVKDPRLMPAA